MPVKLMNVKFGLKTSGEKKTVMPTIHKSTVPVHSSSLNVPLLDLVKN